MLSSERIKQYIASAPRDFTTGEGRLALYLDWRQRRIAEGTISKDKGYTPEERMGWLADWLRGLVAQKILNPHERFPPYARIAPIFHLCEQDVARVIRQLRDEKVFPPRKTRKDAGEPQWTPRDRFLWEYIGQMRAMRFDQVRRLAARESEYEIEGGLLSVSRTSEIIDRWQQKKIAVYRHVYHRQGGRVGLSYP